MNCVYFQQQVGNLKGQRTITLHCGLDCLLHSLLVIVSGCLWIASYVSLTGYACGLCIHLSLLGKHLDSSFQLILFLNCKESCHWIVELNFLLIFALPAVRSVVLYGPLPQLYQLLTEILRNNQTRALMQLSPVLIDTLINS